MRPHNSAAECVHDTSFGGLTVFPVWLDGPGVTGLD